MLQLQFLSSRWWAVCRPKHVEQLRNTGIINPTTRLHLVCSFYEIYESVTIYLLSYIFLYTSSTPKRVQSWTGPEGSRRLAHSKTSYTWMWKFCQAYAPAAFTPGDISGTRSCQILNRHQRHSAAGRIMSMKSFDDLIGNRTLDLPACGAVPQPTALPPDSSEWYL